jgi:MFS family permease
VLHGIGFGLVLVGGVTYVARHAPAAVAATAQGVLSATVFSLALIIGPSIGSFTAAAWGATAMFWLSCVAGLTAVPLLWIAIGSGAQAPAIVTEA